jgi:hypothetical protein
MEHLGEDKLKSEIIDELNNLTGGGVLFNSIEYKSLSGFEDFISNMTDEQAKLCLIEAVKYSFSRGLYTLEESEVLSKSLRILSK